MSYEDDEEQDALAAEYVLGTLDANERAQAHALIGLDPGFAALVRTWERRLGELNVMVEPAEPPPETWARIKARIAGGPAVASVAQQAAPAAPMPQPSAPPHLAAVPPSAPPVAAVPPAPAAPASPYAAAPVPYEPTAFFRNAPIVNINPGALGASPPPPTPAPFAPTAAPAPPPSSPVAPTAAAVPPPQPSAPPEPSIDFGPLPKFEPFTPPPAAPPAAPSADAPAPPSAAAEPGQPANASENLEFPGLAELVAERQKVLQTAPEPSPEQDAEILKFRRRAKRWRAYAGLVTAMAACLAGYMVVWAYRPDRLPPNLRLPNIEKIQVVEREVQLPAPPPPPPAAAPPTPARFVAVLQREPSAPAFLLTVDTQNRTLTVRRVAAGTEPGKSYELWLVSNRLPGPRSLGVVGSDEFTRRPLAETFAPDVVNSATYAVSLEPEGGSPTGSPTGPVLFTGRLVESLPAQPASSP